MTPFRCRSAALSHCRSEEKMRGLCAGAEQTHSLGKKDRQPRRIHFVTAIQSQQKNALDTSTPIHRKPATSSLWAPRGPRRGSICAHPRESKVLAQAHLHIGMSNGRMLREASPWRTIPPRYFAKRMLDEIVCGQHAQGSRSATSRRGSLNPVTHTSRAVSDASVRCAMTMPKMPVEPHRNPQRYSRARSK